ncbi:MAG: hypothetical protein QMD07_04390 [Thermodesulfovibrionales bacterium]|nr:hypothetical protein [Thermodesulfovibrionales bacterium]
MPPENYPKLQDEIVEKTAARYREILGILTGQGLYTFQSGFSRGG